MRRFQNTVRTSEVGALFVLVVHTCDTQDVGVTKLRK